MATSGDYERFKRVAGKRYHHIINPQSGRPAGEVISVTVIAPNALLADGLSTAISSLGLYEGLDLIEKIEEAEALVITEDENTIKIFPSTGF